MMDVATRWAVTRAAGLHWLRGGLLLGGLLLLALPAQGQESRRLDDWERTYKPNENVGKWNARKFSPVFGNGDSFFYQFVHEMPDGHYLHVKSGKNNSFSVGVETPFRMQDWPVLSWEWRVTVLPKGGDVRVEARDDQAGSMCIIEGPGTLGFDAALCYLWENEGPKDTPITSRKNEKARYLILRTGAEDGTGQWVSEQRNIMEDFRTVFGRDPKADAALGVQIDSNDTASSGEAFYRNIIMKKK